MMEKTTLAAMGGGGIVLTLLSVLKKHGAASPATGVSEAAGVSSGIQ